MADHYFQGKLKPAALNGKIADAADIEVAASGFDGNLATTDTDLQKVAQKVDDLSVSGGGLSAGEIGTFAVTTSSNPAHLQYQRNASNQITLGLTPESLEDRVARSQYIWIGDRRCRITAKTEFATAAQITFTGYSVPDPGPATLTLYWDSEPQTATDVAVDARNFTGNLATTDDTVQKVARKVDELDISSGGGGGAASGEIGEFSHDSNPSNGEYSRESANRILLGISDSALRSRVGALRSMWIGSTRVDVTSTTVGASTVDVTFTGYSVPTGTPDLTLYYDPAPHATNISVSAAAFSGNLETTDDNVQKVANRLDGLDVASFELGPATNRFSGTNFAAAVTARNAYAAARTTPSSWLAAYQASTQTYLLLEDQTAGTLTPQVLGSAVAGSPATVFGTGSIAARPTSGAPASGFRWRFDFASGDTTSAAAMEALWDARTAQQRWILRIPGQGADRTITDVSAHSSNAQRVLITFPGPDDTTLAATNWDVMIITTTLTWRTLALVQGSGQQSPGIARDAIEGFALKDTSDRVPIARLNPIQRRQLEWDARPVQERGYMLGEMIGQYSEAPSADSVGTNQYWRVSDSQLEIVDDALTAAQKSKLLLETTVWLNDNGYHVTISNPTGNRFELLLTDTGVAWPAAGAGVDLHWNASAASSEMIEDFAEVGAVGTVPASRLGAASITKDKLAQGVIDEIEAGASEFWYTSQTLSVAQTTALHEHIVHFLGARSATVTLPDMSSITQSVSFVVEAMCDVDSVGLTITMTGDGGQTNPTRTAIIINGDFVHIEWTGSTWTHHVTQLANLFREARLTGTTLDFARQNPNAAHRRIDLAPIIPDPATNAEAVAGTDNADYITPLRLNEVLSHHHIETGDRAYFGALDADPTSVTGLEASPIPNGAGTQIYTVDTTWGGSRYFYIVQGAGEIDVTDIRLDGLEDTGWTKGTFTESGNSWEYWKSPHTWDSAASQGVVISVDRGVPEPEPAPVYHTRKTRADVDFTSFIGDEQGAEILLTYFARQSSDSIRLETTTATDVDDITVGSEWWISWNDLEAARYLVTAVASPTAVQRDVTLHGVAFPAEITTFRIWRNVGAPHMVLAPGADADYIDWPDEADELRVTLVTSNDWVHSGYLQYQLDQGGHGVWRFVREVGAIPDAESPDTAQASISLTTDGDTHTHVFRRETFRTSGKLRLRILNHLSWTPATAPAAQGHVSVQVEHLVGRREAARAIQPLTSALNINRSTRSALGTGTSTTVSWSLVRFPESLETKRVESITVYTHRRAAPRKTEMQRCALAPTDIRMLGVEAGDPGNDTEQWKVALWWGNEDSINPPTFNPSRGFIRDFVNAGPRCLLKLRGEQDYLTGFQITQIVDGDGDDQVRLEPEAVEIVYR